ncbi:MULTISPECIES: DUF4269 domain-containing protein [Sphingobacterium]|uniref:DUF4269 domain-containing protein n=1 Tax=Sphingobacterium TaxID=28453 RepID=UPI001048FF13|nr:MULTISPECIES: DUF4269 domain-containing protein [Sphingobacterium]MCW2259876.1 putative iron-regulated protein [Sphingobacterium kitahiroshimense]TCR11327.1 uncharacterized protein DUF4269 [Sphingobacterium sp. JUb78]
MKIDFRNINYLKLGNTKQRKIHNIITKYQLFEILNDYKPILVGTIPINIDIEESDVDIILQAHNLKELTQLLLKSFAQFAQFRLSTFSNGALTSNFMLEDTLIEIYATDIDTEKQNGYLHMIKEYEILQARNDSFKMEIIKLKKQGIKTEPAFCKLLNISGDPYVELLNYIVQ